MSKKQKKHLWQDKKPISEILQSENIQEIKNALESENTRLNNVIEWLTVAYTNKETIQILNACGFDENEIALYGFDKEQILDAIENANGED